MRLGERITATVGAVTVTLLGLAAPVVLAVHGASAPRVASVDLARVPDDITWQWITSCAGVPMPVVYTMTWGDDGVARVDMGEVGADGSPLFDQDGHAILDPEGSARLEGCMSDHRVEPRLDSPRVATDAERLMLVDWVLRWERPCLAGHGHEVTLPPFSEFLTPGAAPHHLLLYDDTPVLDTGSFEELLGTRRACEPLPPFLAHDGVY